MDGRQTVVQGLDFGVATDWFTLSPSQHTIRVVQGGETLTEYPVDFTLQRHLTLALIGSVGLGTLQLHPIYESWAELPEGESRLGVFHAVEGVAAVDVLLNGDALFQFINYPDSDISYTSADILSKTYTLSIRDHTQPDIALFEIEEIDLQSKHAYIVALAGNPSQPQIFIISTNLQQIAPNTLFAEQALTTMGYLRVLHASSGTADIGINISDGSTTINRVSFASVSDFVELKADTYTIVGFGDILPTVDVELQPGQWQTIVLTGANQDLQIVTFVDDFRALGANEARISIFQGIPGIPPVNVQLADGTMFIRLLGYPGSQGNNDGFEAFDLVAGTYHLQVVSAADEDDVIVDLPDQRIAAGYNYLLALLRAEPPYILTFVEVPSG